MQVHPYVDKNDFQMKLARYQQEGTEITSMPESVFRFFPFAAIKS